MICTWKDCNREAVKTQKDKNGQSWAHLCQKHHDELESSLTGKDIKKLLGAWVKARGGAEAAAKQLFG